MRWSPTALLVVVALVVGGLVIADLGAPSEATDRPDPVAAGPAVGGAWYCAAGAVTETNDLSVLTAAPMTSSAPSDTEVRALGGNAAVVATLPVFPGSARLTEIVGEGVQGDAVGAAVRWWDEPTATSRIWTIGGQGASGMVSGPCASAPSPTWYVPGMSTAEGGTAQLHLANPFAGDASVSISFTTPTGPVAPILLENVSVPSSSVVVVDLGEHIPRQADIGVAVQTRAGRVVVEGVQRLDPAIGGVDAVALVRAAPRLSETWTMPWSLTDPVEDAVPAPEVAEPGDPTEDGTEDDAEDGTEDEDADNPRVVRTVASGRGTASWLWVSNPGEEAAAVTVTLHTADGALVPDIGDELLVEGGHVLRVDLRGLLPAGQAAAGATVRSENGVPVAAGTATLVGSEVEASDRTGYTFQLGWAGGAESWVVPGETGDGRRQTLHVVNPGADPAVVDVAVWDGAALRRPVDLQGVEVAAGALVELNVTDVVAGASQMVAFVTATEGTVVVGRHGVRLSGQADWVAHTGVPATLWSGGDVVPPVDHDPQLIERLGTTGGLPNVDPDAITPSPDPSPTPTLSPTSSPTSPEPSPTPTATGG